MMRYILYVLRPLNTADMFITVPAEEAPGLGEKLDYYKQVNTVTDPQLIIGILKEIQRTQQEVINSCIENITRPFKENATFREVCEGILEGGRIWFASEVDSMRILFAFMRGRFIVESGFWNEETASSLCSEETIYEVEQNPSNYILVVYDAHC